MEKSRTHKRVNSKRVPQKQNGDILDIMSIIGIALIAIYGLGLILTMIAVFVWPLTAGAWWIVYIVGLPGLLGTILGLIFLQDGGLIGLVVGTFCLSANLLFYGIAMGIPWIWITGILVIGLVLLFVFTIVALLTCFFRC